MPNDFQVKELRKHTAGFYLITAASRHNRFIHSVHHFVLILSAVYQQPFQTWHAFEAEYSRPRRNLFMSASIQVKKCTRYAQDERRARNFSGVLRAGEMTSFSSTARSLLCIRCERAKATAAQCPCSKRLIGLTAQLCV